MTLILRGLRKALAPQDEGYIYCVSFALTLRCRDSGLEGRGLSV
jgi:hypothetical protein